MTDRTEASDPGASARSPLGEFLERVLGGLAAVLMFSMMAVTFVDVLGRYLFNAPLPGGFELTEFMLATLIFIGLPMITADNGHVTVDLMDTLIPKVIKPIQDLVLNLISAVVIGIMAWRLWLLAERMARYGDTTAFLEIPYAPLVYFMSVMSGVTTLVLVANAVHPFLGALVSARGSYEKK